MTSHNERWEVGLVALFFGTVGLRYVVLSIRRGEFILARPKRDAFFRRQPDWIISRIGNPAGFWLAISAYASFACFFFIFGVAALSWYIWLEVSN
jgi:hypothetical protein